MKNNSTIFTKDTISLLFKVVGVCVFVFLPILMHLIVDPNLRPAGDDYCMYWHVDGLGLQGFHDRLMQTSSARHSYFVSLNLFFRLGDAALIIAPLLSWVGLITALTQSVNIAQRVMKQPQNWFVSVISAGVIANLFYSLTTNSFQNFYWATGVLIYGVSMALAVFTANYLVKLLLTERQNRRQLVTLAALSLFTAMFNEPITLTVLVILFGALAVAWRLKAAKSKIITITISFIAFVSGLLFMLLSPGATARFSKTGGRRQPLLDEAAASWDKVWDVFSLVNVELIALPIVFTMLAVFAYPKFFKVIVKPYKYTLPLIWLIAMGSLYFVIMLSVLASRIDFVPLRTIITPNMALSIAMLYTAIVAAYGLRHIFNTQHGKKIHSLVPKLLALVAVLTLLFVAFSSFSHQLVRAELYVQRTLARQVLWDQRDTHIRSIGATDETLYFEPVHVPGGIKDLRTPERNWLNDCIAYYYGYEAGQIRTYDPKEL